MGSLLVAYTATDDGSGIAIKVNCLYRDVQSGPGNSGGGSGG